MSSVRRSAICTGVMSRTKFYDIHPRLLADELIERSAPLASYSSPLVRRTKKGDTVVNELNKE